MAAGVHAYICTISQNKQYSSMVVLRCCCMTWLARHCRLVGAGRRQLRSLMTCSWEMRKFGERSQALISFRGLCCLPLQQVTVTEVVCIAGCIDAFITHSAGHWCCSPAVTSSICMVYRKACLSGQCDCMCWCRRRPSSGTDNPRGGDNPYVSPEGHNIVDVKFYEGYKLVCAVTDLHACMHACMHAHMHTDTCCFVLCV